MQLIAAKGVPSQIKTTPASLFSNYTIDHQENLRSNKTYFKGGFWLKYFLFAFLVAAILSGFIYKSVLRKSQNEKPVSTQVGSSLAQLKTNNKTTSPFQNPTAPSLDNLNPKEHVLINQLFAEMQNLGDSNSKQRYEQIIKELLADPHLSVEMLLKKTQSFPLYEAQLRSAGWSLISELVIQTRMQNRPQELAQIETELMIGVRQEIENKTWQQDPRLSNLSQKEQENLRHDLGYKFENGQGFANIYSTQYLALSALAEVNSLTAIAELRRIAQDQNVSAELRDAASRIKPLD